MNLKHFLCRQTVNNLSRLNERLSYPYSSHLRNLSTVEVPLFSSAVLTKCNDFTLPQNSLTPRRPNYIFKRYMHLTQESKISNPNLGARIDSEEEDGDMNEFLSRFVWIMRGKLSEAYPDCDKQTIDAMLLIIVGKVVSEIEKGSLEQMLSSNVPTPSQDFSEDLWKTVWEVSNKVLEDMHKARKKEKMKGFLQSEDVKEMCRFAGEVGIRGDMLRELRFKWAREKMEESEFYESLEKLREAAKVQEEAEGNDAVALGEQSVDMGKPKVVTLPKRHGKIAYKIYGLDLSNPEWSEVADKIRDSGEVIWPPEPKPITGKCKLVTEKILSLKQDEDPASLLVEWKELLQPSRIDWINMLDRLQGRNAPLYFKVAELVLDEKSFQTNIRDYSKLIDSHAKENRLDDAERILKKMNINGIMPDILTASALIHMYSKAGNLERAKEAFESLRSYGFRPDEKVYNSMIMAYVKDGQPKLGESLMREMEARDIKPSKEIYLALLRSFAQRGDVSGAGRIATTMQFAGFQPTLESCTLLVEAYGQAGDPDQARSNFDHMLKLGHKPDDRCTASMITAYEKKNLLDKALNLLLHLEKDGFEPGVATYTVLVDWLGKLQLVDEVEKLLGKIGENPPLKVQVSLCDMYARAGIEKKALQSLGILEAKKKQMAPKEFERVITALIAGGFVQEARRVNGLMEAEGHAASDQLKVALMASQTLSRKRPTVR